jgi:hypothetical protein
MNHFRGLARLSASGERPHLYCERKKENASSTFIVAKLISSVMYRVTNFGAEFFVMC